MDWKYILSLKPEDLNEESMEDLYSTLAWYDFENEVFDSDKYITVLKLSQEVMKFKAEQVQMLLTELDELAIKQGEEEAKKLESDTDGRSSKSRLKSPISADYSDLEQKYVDLKLKYKQQSKVTEKFKRNTEELKIKLIDLEQERDQLQLELQKAFQDGSQSDISESIREQHKELVDTLHSKNTQISSLLKDLEETESENAILKEKLVQVRDELSEATEELVKINNKTATYQTELEETSVIIEELSKENAALKDQIKDFADKEKSYGKQIEELKKELNTKIDEWKRILDEKNEEINKLTTETKTPPALSSSTNKAPKAEYTANLNKILCEREAQIEMLQKQLQGATKEMEETTDILNRISHEKGAFEKRAKQLGVLNADLKEQLKVLNERCQQLQDEIAFLEESYQIKDKDLNDIIVGLKGDESKLELFTNLTQMQNLKTDCRLKEKKIIQLVKTSNKLQEAFDTICLENEAMRDKLGLQENDSINVNGVLIKYKKQKKALQNIHLQLSKLEDENVDLKIKIKDLNRKNAKLSKEILKLGGVLDESATAPSEKSNISKISSETHEEMKSLVEENEALRKGLHEILQSLQNKNESVQSITLEKLLRALDAKHISGWYHPAMRLQAELHTLQGVNLELREQLKQHNRAELVKYKESVLTPLNTEPVNVNIPCPKTLLKIIPQKISKAEEGIINNLNQHLLNVLEIHKQTQTENDFLKEKLLAYQADFVKLQEEIKIIDTKSKEENQTLSERVQILQQENKSLEETATTAEAKLKEYMLQLNLTSDEKAQHAIELAVNVAILNRKCLYFEKQESDLKQELNNLQNDLLTAENNFQQKSSELSAIEKQLKIKLTIAENELCGKVDAAALQELQKDLDDLDLKYKKLLREFNHLCSENTLEVKILNETTETLKKEKHELEEKLKIAMTRIYNQESNEDVNLIAKKLAETEVNEITERQRANHVQNLYELVKEQLQKSEDRFKEFEEYNKEIMHKNLLLQEGLKDLQNQVLNYVDSFTFKDLQTKYSGVLKENETLSLENEKLKEAAEMLNSKLESFKLWSSSQDYELLSLKHQIVDLQAATDDKTVIARLSSDVVNARLAENKMEQKVKILMQKLEECRNKCTRNEDLLKQEKEIGAKLKAQFEQKIGILRDSIKKQRQQYYGCIPLSIQEKFIEKLKQAALDKTLIFKSLCDTQNVENESYLLKEALQKEYQLLEGLKSSLEENENTKDFLLWQEEQKLLKLENLKLTKLIEFKENQIKQYRERINKQDDQIIKLEEELLQVYQKTQDIPISSVSNVTHSIQKPLEIVSKLTLFDSKQTQTLDSVQDETNTDFQNKLDGLQLKILENESDISGKDNIISQLKSKISELEMNISLFRQQIGDKQSQIMFYEKHILELRGKLEKTETLLPEETIRDSNVIFERDEENNMLKVTVNNLQSLLKSKEEAILNYQTLLKKDRDEHSLAAARMQEELKRLHNALMEQQKANLKIQEVTKTEPHPGRAAIEQYILQVHQLENHTAELHTTVTSLTSQLQASRQEAVRWRTLANDRLETMEQLRKDLEEQHQNEIMSYKNDSEKWRQEVTKLKQLLYKFKTETTQVVPDLNKVLKEKEDKIHELTVLLRQARGEVKRHAEKDKDDYNNTKFNELLTSKEQLLREQETLKTRYEQLLNKEKGARDEIRELRYQLMKRPALSSARSDKSDKTIKEQLQRKITILEKELAEAKDNLEKQISINDNHKVKMNEDFEKWKKQKHWQQMAEKLKAKLKEKEDGFEKLQQTCSGYRILIERLEREKHSLETRIKLFKNGNPLTMHSQIETLRTENIKLQAEVEVLNSKLEMSQHHSGGLGAAMLQEKLESQERKIAVLELASKGTVEVRIELERLQSTVANLQKKNLCLEAENLELKLDLEKSAGDVPHMKEQIQHLESYVEALKTENESLKLCDNTSERPEGVTTASDTKKVAELEKTVFVLKRVVEKLQAENKRLLSGSRLCTLADRSSSTDQLRRDLNRIKQQYGASVQKVARLEQELSQANSRIKILEGRGAPANFGALSEELCEVTSQLAQKTALLDKVKLLLQRAATKEKALQEENEDLRRQLRSSTPEKDT